METYSLHETIPVRSHHEVLVAGGGLAGVAAALAARRAGRSVLLIEKTTLLGGLATIGLINYFVPLCNGRGRQIIFGMAEEFLRRAIRRGFDTLPPEWRDGPPATPTNVRYVTRYSPSIFALELVEWVLSEGVDLLFDCVAAHPVMGEDGRVAGVVTESKSGRELRRADVFVDATGDADLCARAGVPTVTGRNFFTYLGFGTDLDRCRKAAESGRIGDLYVPRAGGKANLYGGGHPESMPYFHGTTVEDVTAYLTAGQRQLLANIADEPREQREIVTLPTMPQLRTTRRLDGDYTLTPEDAYRHFPDSVGAICDFDRRDYLFEVPLRTLTRQDAPNLIAVGRIASARDYAWDVLRVIPPAILTGQAAGVVAATALSTGCAVASAPIDAVQRDLSRAGVLIHFDDAWVPSGEASDAGGRVESDHI